MIKKVLLTLILFAISLLVHAQASPDNYSYLFHLYYDSGKLYVDRDVKFKYDVIPEQFVPDNSVSATYTGKIIGVKDNFLATFKFAKPNFEKGTLVVKGPYFADAKSAEFYDDKNQKLVTIDVSGSSFCNDDSICNADVGEDSNNCPSDCKQVSLPTETPSPSISPLPAATDSTSKIGLILYALGIVVLILVGFYMWTKFRNKQT